MSHTTFDYSGLPTMVGSMPHTDPQKACRLVAKYLPDIPTWPQLPARSFLENMYVQYSEGFPGVVLEEERIYIDRTADLSAALEQLYTSYIDGESERYAVCPEYAAGLYTFLETGLGSPRAVKGQVTGPVSWGLAVTDQERRPVLYDDTLADALAKFLQMKAAWQERRLGAIADDTIVFLDEPYMASLGSAYVSLQPAQVVSLIDEAFLGIHGLKGIHCCANTDWSVLLQTSLDILSFDAYGYSHTITLYPEEVKAFLHRGGIIAWGIVPNEEEALAKETASSIIDRLEEWMGVLDRKGIAFRMLAERCLLTPSCGLSPLSEEAAEWALELLATVSAAFRKRYRRE